MIVIGLVGEKGSGKGAFTNLLRTILPSYIKFASYRFSDPLVQTLTEWDIPATRANLQNFIVIMENQFGKGLLSARIKKMVRESQADIIILDGIRRLSDVEMLRDFPNNILLYITAPPEIRYNRIKARGEKIGEAETTWGQFITEDNAPTESLITTIGETQSDWTIANAVDEADFKTFLAEVTEFFVWMQSG